MPSMEKGNSNQTIEPQMDSKYEEEPPPPYVPPVQHNKSLPELPQVPSDEEGPSNDSGFSTPVYYTRDPRKLIGYVIPFPRPLLELPVEDMPSRFLIYTPPPPPLKKPTEGEKEGVVHKFQRKWQEEVRDAKDTSAQRTRWQNVKSKTTRGVDWCINQTTSSNVDFLVRIDASSTSSDKKEKKDKKKQEHHRSDSAQTSNASLQTSDAIPQDHGAGTPRSTDAAPAPERPAGLSEIVLAYPPTLPGTPASIRAEFVDKTLRTKSRTQRDAVIATGLLPFSVAADILMTPVLPFVPLMQVNAAWAFFAIRGSRAARKATKQLELGDEDAAKKGEADDGKSADGNDEREERVKFTFRPAPGLEVLQRYLAARCREKDDKLFPEVQDPPTEGDLLEAIGWSPSLVDEEGASEGELAAVKDDVRQVMAKAAREWRSWCKSYAKNPKKAVKK